MNNNTKISFVMPVYNFAETIIEAVESIMQSNFTDGDELIIVNDASTDNTENIILKLQKKYPVIKIINNNENIGCPASRNVGIKAGSNYFIFNMDADDILARDSVAPLQKYLVENKADIAAFAESRYFIKDIKHLTHKWVTKGGIFTLSDFLAGSIIPGGNCLYTKSSWQKINGYFEYGKGLHEFWGFALKQLGGGAKFVVLPNSFYFHRYGHNSLFASESKKENESLLMATKMIMNFIDLINPEDAEYIKSGQNWFDNLAKRPIRLKTGEIGSTGHKVILKQGNVITKALKKSKLVMGAYNIYKNIK